MEGLAYGLAIFACQAAAWMMRSRAGLLFATVIGAVLPTLIAGSSAITIMRTHGEPACLRSLNAVAPCADMRTVYEWYFLGLSIWALALITTGYLIFGGLGALLNRLNWRRDDCARARIAENLRRAAERTA